MRILADENVAGAVVNALTKAGCDVVWIAKTTPGSTDALVFDIACKENRILLTHDKDFAAGSARKMSAGLKGVILLRLDGIAVDTVADFVSRTISSRDDWQGSYSIVKKNNIRMRKLS